MKRTLFLTAALICLASSAKAATYTDLTGSWCDETNNVIYDGKGYFAVESVANTAVDITINLASLVSYVNSNDYTGSSYMLLWENSIQNYGLGDNADKSLNTGSRTPYLSGYTTGAWNANTNNISYDTLSKYAVGDYVTLSITNHTSNGVAVKATNSEGVTDTLYSASALKYGSMSGVSGYYVNLNYVTGVTLHTPSTLDTATYVPPVDYSAPFVSQRTDGTTVGRVTFLGDSITHGVNDQSYRWQLFKTLTDNGIENEIAGPREGYYNSSPEHTEDAGNSYGGAKFANVHLAQASGRTHNIISGSNSGMTGVNYGGHSTASTAKNYDSNTWFCMMGTNDMLSDSGASTTDYCNKMAKMLGGTVSYAEGTGYTWTADSTNWGTMGTIVDDVHGEGDTFYMLSITPWTQHANSNTESYHYGAQEFNRNLELWTDAYNKAHAGKNVVYVDVTRGMIDKTSDVSFYSPGAFFNAPGSDGLHPNDQGSIIIAGNLARAMGIGGRTAGLQRQDTTGWSAAPVSSLSAGSSQLWAANAFTMENGYSIDLNASFGDGEKNGWATTDTRLAISLGDGTNSGTLNVSEGYISWGSDVLFCWDNSTLANEGNLRIAWHNGNSADNVLQGYYVWLGDMLIGQGLEATTDTGLNGILLSAYGADAALNTLSWSNTAYAPSTTGTVSTEHAFITTQDAAISTLIPNKAYTTSGVDFTAATVTKAAAGQVLVSTATPESNTFKLESAAGWTALTSATYSEDINVQVTGKTVHTIFGAKDTAKAGQLTLEIAEGATIGNGTYSNKTAAIAGSYNGGQAEAFNVYVEGGTVEGDIVGGAVHGSGHIDSVRIVVNNGTIQGGIYGGSKTSGSVDNAHIVINGGIVINGINAGGTDGSVTHAQITITGGTVTGGITRGNARNADVIIQGSTANIIGSIEADSLTLYNVRNNMAARVKSAKDITTAGNTNTAIAVQNEIELNSLHLGDTTTLSVLNTTDTDNSTIEDEATITVTELIVGSGVTLNANLLFTQEALLRMEGMLTMGSSITLRTGMTLDLADSMLDGLYNGEIITLFAGVDDLSVDNSSIAAGTFMNATDIFTGLNSVYTYYMSYDGSNVSLSIPEPTTATLSLLALTALAARRRRK